MITLSAGDLRLSIDPALGAGIADFALRGPAGYFYPLMRRTAPGETNASLLGSFFMAPWVNRIAGASFEFAGTRHTLRPTTPAGTPAELIVAQHGDVRKRSWSVSSQSDAHVTLTFVSASVSDANWPWRFACEATYRLHKGDGRSYGTLEIELAVINRDQRPFPAGCGHHPYFMRRLWSDRDEIQVRVPVAARYALTNGCASAPPQEDALTRQLRSGGALPDQQIDSVFASLGGPDRTATLRWPASGVELQIEPDPALGHWVVYAPREPMSNRTEPLPIVAVEPQSQVNNALVMDAAGVAGTGTQVLDPGQALRTNCVFRVSKLG